MWLTINNELYTEDVVELVGFDNPTIDYEKVSTYSSFVETDWTNLKEREFKFKARFNDIARLHALSLRRVDVCVTPYNVSYHVIGYITSIEIKDGLCECTVLSEVPYLLGDERYIDVENNVSYTFLKDYVTFRMEVAVNGTALENITMWVYSYEEDRYTSYTFQVCGKKAGVHTLTIDLFRRTSDNIIPPNARNITFKEHGSFDFGFDTDVIQQIKVYVREGYYGII